MSPKETDRQSPLYLVPSDEFDDDVAGPSWVDDGITTFADVESIIDTIDDRDPHCVVFETGNPDGYRSVLDTLADRYPSLPVVLYTPADIESISNDVHETVETVVKRWDNGESSGLLQRKVQSVLGGYEMKPPETREEYELFINTARDGVYSLDAGGHFDFVNESMAEMLEFGREELIGMHISRIQAPGQLEVGQSHLSDLLEKEEGSRSEVHDMTFRTKSGTNFVASTSFTVRYSDDGEYDGIVATMRDVTDQRRQERELQRQRERLEEFSSVVAHDLRNPLTVIQGNLEAAIHDAPESADWSRFLENAAESADRMERMISDLLDLARAGTIDEEPEPFAFEPIVVETWGSLDTADATLDVRDPPESVSADRDRLRQLLENVIRNAIEHGGEDVTVTVGSLESEPGFYVADDGPGIAIDDPSRVFEHGVTTDGTGYGLSIVSTIAEAHDWEVSATESASGGARFEVNFDPIGVGE